MEWGEIIKKVVATKRRNTDEINNWSLVGHERRKGGGASIQTFPEGPLNVCFRMRRQHNRMLVGSNPGLRTLRSKNEEEVDGRKGGSVTLAPALNQKGKRTNLDRQGEGKVQQRGESAARGKSRDHLLLLVRIIRKVKEISWLRTRYPRVGKRSA